VSEELRKAYQEVTSLNRAKDKAINHLSHELKTPVAILSSSLNLLAKRMADLPDETWKPTLERIKRNLDRILAESYLNKRQWTQAIQALENYKRRLQYDSYAYEKLAGLYMQLGQKEAALPNLIELHRRTMKDPKYARQAADIYRADGQAENALKYYDDVIHINPYDATAYTNMAGLYLSTKQNDKALQAVHAVTLLEPDKADSWTQTALVCYRLYKAQKSPALAQQARAAIEKALQIDPNSPRAGEILALLNEELPPASQPAESPQ
jgi:tetratricopeptide (TPR) repeat protein